jgi:hypothetical protein
MTQACENNGAGTGPDAVPPDPADGEQRPRWRSGRRPRRVRAARVRRPSRLIPALIAIAVVAVGLATPSTASVEHRPTSSARLSAQIARSTAKFHDIATAESDGYGLFHDVNGIACIDEPGMGGMGVHYVNAALIGDAKIVPSTPEAIVYAPDRHGTLRIAALEYIVIKSDWDAAHSNAPRLYRGRPFDVTAAPNRYGLPAFYSQHVWVWKHNPAGLLAMWNPTVHCAWA